MRACIACGCGLPEQPLMTLDHMPASAQNIPDGETVAADEGITLNLCQCPSCGLVQFDCEPVDYYRSGRAASPPPWWSCAGDSTAI